MKNMRRSLLWGGSRWARLLCLLRCEQQRRSVLLQASEPSAPHEIEVVTSDEPLQRRVVDLDIATSVFDNGVGVLSQSNHPREAFVEVPQAALHVGRVLDAALPTSCAILAGLLTLVALWRMRGVALRPRTIGHVYCAKCNYEVQLVSMCPECGAVLSRVKPQVGKSVARRLAPIAVPALLVVALTFALRSLPPESFGGLFARCHWRSTTALGWFSTANAQKFVAPETVVDVHQLRTDTLRSKKTRLLIDASIEASCITGDGVYWAVLLRDTQLEFRVEIFDLRLGRRISAFPATSSVLGFRRMMFLRGSDELLLATAINDYDAAGRRTQGRMLISRWDIAQSLRAVSLQPPVVLDESESVLPDHSVRDICLWPDGRVSALVCPTGSPLVRPFWLWNPGDIEPKVLLIQESLTIRSSEWAFSPRKGSLGAILLHNPMNERGAYLFQFFSPNETTNPHSTSFTLSAQPEGIEIRPYKSLCFSPNGRFAAVIDNTKLFLFDVAQNRLAAKLSVRFGSGEPSWPAVLSGNMDRLFVQFATPNGRGGLSCELRSFDLPSQFHGKDEWPSD